MDIRQMNIAGAYQIIPRQSQDARGTFFTAYRPEDFTEAIGYPLSIVEARSTVSKAGVIRGLHYSLTPPAQGKLVSCVRGAILDVVVDIRLGSPTFGRWDSVILDDENCAGVYLSPGLAHGFLSLEDRSTVSFLVSGHHDADKARAITPLDETLAIQWPTAGRDGSPLEFSLAESDADAPTLAAANDADELPQWDECLELYKSLVHHS